MAKMELMTNKLSDTKNQQLQTHYKRIIWQDISVELNLKVR